jgi:hypothetical protein
MKQFTIACLLFLSVFNLKAQTPTWSDNIACIVYTNCTKCHNPNGIAPSSFLNYSSVVPYAYGMKLAVNDKRMPPFPPDLTYQRYAHERGLTQEEIDLINAWVDGGAPEGNPANAPIPPVYNSAAEITSPDLTLQMPTYTVPASISSDLYRCFPIATNLSTDMFMTGFEVLPGNRQAVHHVLVFADTTNKPFQNDANDPQPGYTSFGGVNSNSAVLIGAWVPGATATFYPNNFGIKLKAGTNIVLQIHYPGSSIGEVDSTKLLMKLSPSLPTMREVRIAPAVNHVQNLDNGPLKINAGATKTFYSTYSNIPVQLTVLGVGPHMHLIGRSIKAYARTAAGDTLKMINIPNWDFHWQGLYQFQKPVIVPAGSSLKGEAFYDNTSNNPFNPNNPPQQVTAGEATTDEMLLVYFVFAIYQNGDQNIIIDTASKQYYNNCDFRSIATVIEENSFLNNAWSNVYPNPADNLLNISSNQSFALRIYNTEGKTVFASENQNNSVRVNTASFQKGIYFVEMKSDEGLTRRKIVIQ